MIMPVFVYDDPFATKAVEYLLVIGFLMALVWYWRVLTRPARGVARASVARRPVAAAGRWFQLPADLFYHPGHVWAVPEGGGVVRVGIDDFAQKLVGEPEALELPEVGARLEQGERGWKLDVNSKSIDVLSPVGGEVVERNEAALSSPEILNQDPYGDGWLVKVKVPNVAANLKNLLSGKLAGAWMQMSEDGLRQRMSGELGLVMQDGGVPISGIAQGLSPEHWDEIAGEFLLTR